MSPSAWVRRGECDLLAPGVGDRGSPSRSAFSAASVGLPIHTRTCWGRALSLISLRQCCVGRDALLSALTCDLTVLTALVGVVSELLDIEHPDIRCDFKNFEGYRATAR